MNQSGVPLIIVFLITLCTGAEEVALSEHNIDVPDSFGRTPLHLAVEKDPKQIAALLAKGVPIDARDHHGRTPLHLV